LPEQEALEARIFKKGCAVMIFKSLVLGLAGASLCAMTGMGRADGLSGAPPPFDKGDVKVALVSYLSSGDFFQAYEAGVTRQAKALGIDLHVFQGRQRPDEEREQIRQAIDLGVKGIIVNGGKTEAVSDVVQEAPPTMARSFSCRDGAASISAVSIQPTPSRRRRRTPFIRS
jgi:ABC-type sugar transport system substrate-binding protein